jgi:FKBP-type peptidyl-prolyl cis-trans isomerase
MNTATGIAVALAVIVALSFLFLGSSIFMPFESQSPEIASVEETNGTLMVTDEVVGTGAEAALGSTIVVDYVGRFEDGQVFDASANHGGTYELTLGETPVIQGWTQGLVGMKEGGTRILTVPPELGYGSKDFGPIPGNSTLIFTIKLLEVK